MLKKCGESDEKIDTIFMKLKCEVNIRQNGIGQEDFFILKNKSKILNQLQHKLEFSVSVTFFILACDYRSYTKVVLPKNSPQYEALVFKRDTFFRSKTKVSSITNASPLVSATCLTILTPCNIFQTDISSSAFALLF